MADDWNVYSKLSHEYDILCRSYAMGKRVTIAYAGKGHVFEFMSAYANVQDHQEAIKRS